MLPRFRPRFRSDRPASLLLALALLALAGGGGAASEPAAAPPSPAPSAESASWDDIERWAQETDPASTVSSTAGAAASSAEAEFSSLELVRRGEDGQERRIRVVRRGTDDAAGIFTICGPQPDEDQNGPSLAVFSESGAGGVEISIDRNLIRVPLALVTQAQREDGSAGDGSIEAGGGSAHFLDDVPEGATDRLSRCAVAATPQDKEGAVQVTQGQTQLTGQHLSYSETDGTARISGPVTFRREAAESQRSGDGTLSGSAKGIEVEVDTERTVLVGDVVLNSEGGRVSRAARVEYDDAAGLARLIGTPEQPATTARGGERLQAAEILYDLTRDEAVAWASNGVRISGEFRDDAVQDGDAVRPF